MDIELIRGVTKEFTPTEEVAVYSTICGSCVKFQTDKTAKHWAPLKYGEPLLVAANKTVYLKCDQLSQGLAVLTNT